MTLDVQMFFVSDRLLEVFKCVACGHGQVISMSMDYYAPVGAGVASSLNLSFFVCFFFFVFFFIENITGKLHYIQNSKLCFHDMKIMSLRNGGDFGKQLVLRTRCLLNHHHS